MFWKFTAAFVKVFQQRFLYRGNREFQNKKLSMFCVFILTFLWCWICGWLQLCIMYMDRVKVLDIQILKVKITFTYKNHLLRFILAALNSKILNEITNILHVIVHLSEGTFCTYDGANAQYLITITFPPLYPYSVSSQSGGYCTSVLTRHLY